MGQWMAEGRLQVRTHVREGLDSAPSALMDLFSGANIVEDAGAVVVSNAANSGSVPTGISFHSWTKTPRQRQHHHRRAPGTGLRPVSRRHPMGSPRRPRGRSVSRARRAGDKIEGTNCRASCGGSPAAQCAGLTAASGLNSTWTPARRHSRWTYEFTPVDGGCEDRDLARSALGAGRAREVGRQGDHPGSRADHNQRNIEITLQRLEGCCGELRSKPMAMAKSTLDQLKIEAGKDSDADHSARWLPDEVEDLSSDQRKERAEQMLEENKAELAEAQELLYADGRLDPHRLPGDGRRRQGWGRSGTSCRGSIRRAVRCRRSRCRARRNGQHNYLWRYSNALPARGMIGIFNRSYHEEVLVVKVHPELLDRAELPRARGHLRSGNTGTRTSTTRAAPGAQRHDDH